MANNFFRLSFIYGFIGLILGFGITYVNSIDCGITDFTRKLIVNGTETQRGEYPFLAALFLIEHMRFICGGSLISAKHVLTAAHCTKDYGIMFVPDDLIVLLGSYDLTSRIERGAVHRDVAEIRVHPDWKVYSDKLDADLAILILSEIVAFTNLIRPVCMPADNSVIPIEKGTIVGWGLTENGTQPHLTYPKHAVTNALNDTYCYTTDYLAAQLSTYRTFCGGGEATSPNQGDSGGGFFVLFGRAWVQYGVISALRTDATGDVDSNSIAIYTKVKEFKKWIKDTVRESGGQVGEAIGLSKIQIQLNCDFNYEAITNLYGCWIDLVDIRSENIEVASFSGSHLAGKTDNDVALLQFRNGTMFYLPDGVGKNFKNLKQLEINKSLNMQLIRRSNFKYLKSLIYLRIDPNNIESMEEDPLWDLPHLEFFALVENKLREIDEKTFVNNPKLREIHLYGNHIESIPRTLFKQNVLLEIISLHTNNLKIIDEVTFVNNPKLREIHLYGNHIESIPRNLFKQNMLLEKVSLRTNNIKTIDEVTFVNNPKLREIQLYDNHIELIPRNLLQQNLLLELVGLNGNNLTRIDEVTFVNNPKLRKIFLYNNHIESIPRNLFKQNLLLEIISLFGNNLTRIDEVTFVNNAQLKEIYLNDNHLEKIPRNLFKMNLLLEKIEFHINSIKTIDIDFTVFKNLKHIYLHANVCINGYYDSTEDPKKYRNEFRNLTEFQGVINVNCSSVKP